jgi:zinc protease
MTPKTLWKAGLAAFMLALALTPANVSAKPWPQAATDIQADPNVRYGMLANGMRYAIQRNATPPGQSSLRLYYDAGSLEETDAQQGLAHFLEHMNFNGSKKVPEGEMIKILQRHGLAFGADTNASTSFAQTVYQLDLPKSDDETVDSSLMLLRQGASELSLDPAAIDRERGVVLSEERSRDTPDYRVTKASLAFMFKDQVASRRMPIGTIEVLKSAGRELIADYYAKYYRPERAVLVAVGDFDVDRMEAKIKAQFADWKGAGPAGPEPQLGAPVKRGPEVKLVVEPGAQMQIQIQWLSPPDTSKDSLAKRQRRTLEQLGLAVLNRRLQRLARAPSPPFIGAQSFKGDALHSAEVAGLQVLARPEQWRTALETAEQEARRLIQYGVRKDELDREIEETRVQLQTAAAQSATRRTPSVANDIVQTLDDDEVYTNPVQDLAMFEQALKGVSAETVSKAIPGIFSGEGPLVFMSSPTPIEGGEASLTKAFAEARAKPVSAPTLQAAKTWPYGNFGAPGKVVQRKTLEDLGVTMVRFQNGVRLTVRPSQVRKDQVLIRARIGRGQLDLPKDRVTPVWAARNAVVEGGLKDLSMEQMEQVLASNVFGADFSTGEDAFVLQGATRPEDFAIQMQVLAAYATVPAFRPEAFQRIRTFRSTQYDQLSSTPSGVLQRELGRLMHGDDPRFSFPTKAQIQAATPEQFKAVLAPRVASGPIEVVITGDVTLDKAIELTAATFGALPPRKEAPATAEAKAVSLPKPGAAPLVLTHTGRADQAIAYAEWAAPDFFADPQLARTLRVLAQVMENRLLDDLREAAGVTYSPQAGATASLVFPKYGYVSAVVEIPPPKIDDFYRDLDKIAADLRTKDVEADELDRAKKPLIEALEKSRQTNEYWLEQLSSAQDEPRKIDAVRGVLDSLRKVDAAMIRQAAQTWLKDTSLWRLQITPQTVAQAGPAAAPAAARSAPGRAP